jgi:hypothetical protein
MTLAMFALAYLAVLRAYLHAPQAPPPQRATTEIAKGGRISSRSI